MIGQWILVAILWSIECHFSFWRSLIAIYIDLRILEQAIILFYKRSTSDDFTYTSELFNKNSYKTFVWITPIFLILFSLVIDHMDGFYCIETFFLIQSVEKDQRELDFIVLKHFFNPIGAQRPKRIMQTKQRVYRLAKIFSSILKGIIFLGYIVTGYLVTKFVAMIIVKIKKR